MKNTFKIILGLTFFSAIFGSVFANITNFNARVSDGSSYSTGTSFMDGPFNVSTGVSLDFETIVQTKAGSGINTYSINLPVGFSGITNPSSGPCNPTSIQYSSNLFKFTVPDLDCIYEFYSKYQVLSSGNHTINLLGTSPTATTLLNSINVNVSGTNTILKANSLDQNNDGIIDGYQITTAQPTVASSFSGLTFSGLPGSVVGSGTLWTISFSGGTIGTSILPQISGNFGGITINNENIIENDTTPPTITNSTSTGGTFASSQTIILSNLSESGTITYSTGGTYIAYTSGININANTTLNVRVTDVYGNAKIYTYIYNFSCGVNPAHGTYGIYPACTALACTDNYTGVNCTTAPVTPPSGGGGGGGGVSLPAIDYCPTGDLSGNFYDKVCTAIITNSGTTNTGATFTGTVISTGTTTSSGTIPGTDIPSSGVTEDIDYQDISPIADLNISTLDKTYFNNLNSSVSYLTGNIINSKVLAFIDSLGKKLTFDGIDYFVTYDLDFVREYNKIINSFTLFALKLNDYYAGNNSTENQTNINILYKNILTGIELIKQESLKEKIWFVDIDSSFAKKDIIYLALKGVVKGYVGNIFKPNSPITRGEFLAMTMKSLGIQTDENLTQTTFSDIPSDGSWMIKYVEKAKEFGIKGQEIDLNSGEGNYSTIGDKYELKMLDTGNTDPSVILIQQILNTNGYNNNLNGILDSETVNNLNDYIFQKTGVKYDTTNLGPQKLKLLQSIEYAESNIITKKTIFRPNDSISRAEALAMLFSIAKIELGDTIVTEFTDIPADGLWMVKYIEKAKELGIAGGQTIDGELKFRPNDGITRAESSRVIVKTIFLNR
ncbi:MAG: S-layer homology domain-containing protein [Candidatus Gracilibacteria bacterium]|nr:S-layer homology domain-containing protein [Candidatus Gracilibacteria bacterium]MDD2908509.1 S-layer homology domain-containing protein [Candidatus Gracilibacteria bacterium]